MLTSLAPRVARCIYLFDDWTKDAFFAFYDWTLFHPSVGMTLLRDLKMLNKCKYVAALVSSLQRLKPFQVTWDVRSRNLALILVGSLKPRFFNCLKNHDGWSGEALVSALDLARESADVEKHEILRSIANKQFENAFSSGFYLIHEHQGLAAFWTAAYRAEALYSLAIALVRNIETFAYWELAEFIAYVKWARSGEHSRLGKNILKSISKMNCKSAKHLVEDLPTQALIARAKMCG